MKMPTHTQLEKHAKIKYNYTGNVKRLSIKEQEDNKKSLNLLKLQRFWTAMLEKRQNRPP